MADRTKEQLESENKELHMICGYLDEECRKSKRLGSEWQSFGKYTAEILKEEIANSEVRTRVMQEELERLAKENRELKEMCLFLDQSREGGEESSLTPPEATELILRGRIAGEMNRAQKQVPLYTGLTKKTILKDSQAIKMGARSETNKEMALTEMKKRLERVETERLELIKVGTQHNVQLCYSSIVHNSSCGCCMLHAVSVSIPHSGCQCELCTGS